MKKVTIKYTTTHQCFTSKPVKSNSYITCPSIKNDTASDNVSNTTYEVDVTSTDNEWKYCQIKYGEEYFNSNHSRSTKNTLKKHVNVSMRAVTIPNIDIEVWTPKSEFTKS